MEPQVQVQSDLGHHHIPTTEVLQEIGFSSVAGAISKLLEYPFDTVKVRLQSQGHSHPPRYRGPLDCFAQSYRRDGIVSLYRGISPPVVGAAIEASALFCSYNVAQDGLRAWSRFSTHEPLPMHALVLCGCVSGAFTSFFLTPIELIKCKIQVPALSQHAHAVQGPPRVSHVVASIYRQEGFKAFWRGQVCTFWRETGGNAFWFGINEFMKKLYLRRASDDQPQSLRLHQHLISGAAAGVGYNFSFYPFDTVKSCQQTEEIGASSSKRSLASIATEIWRHQGIKGFYQGCALTLARSAMGSAIIFTVYDYLKTSFG